MKSTSKYVTHSAPPLMEAFAASVSQAARPLPELSPGRMAVPSSAMPHGLPSALEMLATRFTMVAASGYFGLVKLKL